MMISNELLLTYFYLLVYIVLSSGVILYNKAISEKNNQSGKLLSFIAMSFQGNLEGPGVTYILRKPKGG